MIYTCYEMIRDCRENRAEGWAYFIANYVPVIRKLLAHYGRDGAAAMEVLLAGLCQSGSSLFANLDPAPERWFVAELRQKVLSELPLAQAATPLELETVAAAWQPLTLVEKQAAWLESMGYGAAETGTLLRMAPATVEKIRGRAGELLRGAMDTWSRTLLAENGAALGRSAAAAGSKDCLPAKTFLDVLDGRSTWRGREEMERHLTGCWHCIDHLCRMAEVVEMLRGVQPLSEAECEPWQKLLGVRVKKAGWKRWLGGAPAGPGSR